MVLVDLRSKSLTGKIAELALDRAGITVNKNKIPFDPESPFVTSGIRIGVPAVTTRGMKEGEMARIGALIAKALEQPESTEHLAEVRSEVKTLTNDFPVYRDLLAEL